VQDGVVRMLVRCHLHVKGTRFLAIARHDAHYLRIRIHQGCMDDFSRLSRGASDGLYGVSDSWRLPSWLLYFHYRHGLVPGLPAVPYDNSSL
jgi:hypothetical protein